MSGSLLEIPLRFSDMAAGDENPFSFDFIGLGWTTAADPVVTATVTTSNSNELSMIGSPGISNSVVTVWLSGGCPNTEYGIWCQVTTQFGRKATRKALVFVAPSLPS
jgi:hypothetical protein